jgi:DNA-binding FrmR family transcriptional regulator
VKPEETTMARRARQGAAALAAPAGAPATARAEPEAAPAGVHVSSCGCGVADDDGGRRAVAVDPPAKERNLKRLRRIEGQVRGLQRMVEEDRYCADVMTQIASVHEALRAVGRELMRNHLRHCASTAIRAGDAEADAMYDELLELMYRSVR